MDYGAIDPAIGADRREADEEAIFKFPLRSADDINALQPDDDVGAMYNAKRALAAFVYITDPDPQQIPAR